MARLLVVLTALLATATPAGAEEGIRRFSSDVVVGKDGGLTVTETIDVVAENVRINRGIYRDFPTSYRGRNGSRVHAGFELLGVQHDGAAEPHRTQPLGNGVRIRIGDPDRMVAPGEHRYVIRYRTTRQIGRFSGYDELYWNATGNGWEFPIDVAEVRIRLPGAIPFGQRAFYTGPEGATDRNAQVVEERPGDILVRTTAPLGPREGLTVAVAFPKGVAGEPRGGRLLNWLSDWGPVGIALAALAGLLAYFWNAYRRVGRNPRPGPVVPLFSPPDGLGPAAMRYVWKMGTDDRAFAAALVNLGVHGHVRLDEQDGGWFGRDKRTIKRLDGGDDAPFEELAMLAPLVSPGSSIAMEQKNHAEFQAARKALNEALAKRFGETMFRRNAGWAASGLLLVVLAMFLVGLTVSVASGVMDGNRYGTCVSLLLLTAFLLGLAVRSSTQRSGCALSLAGAVTLGGALLLGGPYALEALTTGWWQPFAILLPAIPVAVSAFWWIAAPTAEGRKVLDRIAGFKQYLSIAEGERLDRMTQPQDTPELFERYLPYAIALGVENRWADRFQAVLAAAAASGQQTMAWYGGTHDWSRDPGGFASSLGNDLSSAISSASTAPGSSSGSGGGGSSGGGGGGGGGGGW